MKTNTAARRRKLQHAAAADCSHTDKKNAGTRKEFGLPRNREFEG